MPAFELFQPASVADTLGVLNRHGADAWVMAGGNDTFDWLKDRIKKPKVVVDLTNVNELRGIKDAGGGLEIGALTTLTTIANDAMVKEYYKDPEKTVEATRNMMYHTGDLGFYDEDGVLQKPSVFQFVDLPIEQPTKFELVINLSRLDMVSPDSQASACLPSGRNST